MSTTHLPAFPTNRVNMNGEVVPDEEGMTLRDYFAAKAFAMLMHPEAKDYNPKATAEMAYRFADAMLAARGDGSPQAADADALNDLRAYFQGAETLHDCYRRIEELERDATRYRTWRDGSCSQPSKFAVALARCFTPHEIDQALDRIAEEAG